jgi:pimeloyl-ACP methyl ester carboxylesterase
VAVVTCKNGDIELEYETFGTNGEPLLLIAPMGNEGRLSFHEDFCTALVESGFHVARFDNRDSGLATHVDPKTRYTVRDMADDAAAVLDALDWPNAHIFGVSLGGIIGQTLAVHHADRVRTLTTVATPPSSQWSVCRPKLGTLVKILALGKPGKGPEGAADFVIKMFKIIGSPDYPIDEKWIRRISSVYPQDPGASMRQMAAMRGAGDRRPELAGITVPTLVIHGGAETMLSPHAARETARVIPGARLVSYPGMGHDLPRELWPSMIGELNKLVAGTMV